MPPEIRLMTPPLVLGTEVGEVVAELVVEVWVVVEVDELLLVVEELLEGEAVVEVTVVMVGVPLVVVVVDVVEALVVVVAEAVELAMPVAPATAKRGK